MHELIIRSLQGHTSPADEARLKAWRAESLANERRYREVSSLWAATAPPAADTLAAVVAPPGDLVARARHRRRRRRTVWLGAISAAAASVVLLLGPGGGLWRPAPDWTLGADEFVTRATETVTMSLSDGTVVRLAPGSQLRLMKGRSARDVWLEGRAFFAVAPLDGAPFRVHSTAGEAVVLGTQFDLDGTGRELRLVVVEGRVQLASTSDRVQVAAGQMSRVFEDGRMVVVDMEDARSTLGWVDDLLVFQAAPMAEVADEIARRFGLAVEIVDPEIEGRAVTAWFSGRTFEDVIAVVCRVVEAQCSIDAQGATIGTPATGG